MRYDDIAKAASLRQDIEILKNRQDRIKKGDTVVVAVLGYTITDDKLLAIITNTIITNMDEEIGILQDQLLELGVKL